MPANRTPPIRRTTFFSGNVQGVGFRYTVCQIAADHAVVGTVKNLLDGRVELIAEGQPSAVDDFVNAVEERMSPYIEYTTGTDSTARGELTSFEIAY